jgi:hypothetical protein
MLAAANFDTEESHCMLVLTIHGIIQVEVTLMQA